MWCLALSTVVCRGGTLSDNDRGTGVKVESGRTHAISTAPRANFLRRLVAGRKRRSIALLVTASLLGTAAVAVAGPSGEWLEGGDQATGGIVKFGPINSVNGFPDWYRDVNGIEVEACLSSFEPKCNAPLASPDPNAEVSFPDNFPDEFFYFTGEASLTANGGHVAGAQYKVTNPYGVDTLVAGDDSTIFVTDDVGVGSGNFGGLFEGQVG